MTLFSKASVYHEANDNYYISGDAKKEYDFEKFPTFTDLIKKPHNVNVNIYLYWTI